LAEGSGKQWTPTASKPDRHRPAYLYGDVAQWHVIEEQDDAGNTPTATSEGNVAHWAHVGGFLAGAGLALLLLFTGLIQARGGDVVSIVLGKHAWGLVGRPNRGSSILQRLP